MKKSNLLPATKDDISEFSAQVSEDTSQVEAHAVKPSAAV